MEPQHEGRSESYLNGDVPVHGVQLAMLYIRSMVVNCSSCISTWTREMLV